MTDEIKEKVSTDTIINWMKAKVESKEIIGREIWLDAAFKTCNMLCCMIHQVNDKQKNKRIIKMSRLWD